MVIVHNLGQEFSTFLIGQISERRSSVALAEITLSGEYQRYQSMSKIAHTMSLNQISKQFFHNMEVSKRIVSRSS